MAAGQGFIEFSTGEVLTAAAANGYLASQVVMVFADSAARTTAITSPQEGMISFLKDTNAVEAYDGAAWEEVGGGSSGSLTLLSTTTINSGTTSQTISSISTSYTQLLIVMKNIKMGGNGASWSVRLNSDTNSNYMSGYVGASFAGTQSGSTLRTDMYFGARNSSSATWNKQGYGQLRLIDYNASGQCQVDYDVINHDGGGGNDTLWYTHAKVIYNASAAVTSFTLIADTNFSSGTVLIYGVN